MYRTTVPICVSATVPNVARYAVVVLFFFAVLAARVSSWKACCRFVLAHHISTQVFSVLDDF